ncbi:MAG: hypothetical protein EOO68_11895 [Moraxellaceae bacterium]|nr:MAG: hypothetical protein EOO68_11895 [Moraxellaceae bacterium]
MPAQRHHDNLIRHKRKNLAKPETFIGGMLRQCGIDNSQNIPTTVEAKGSEILAESRRYILRFTKHIDNALIVRW